jgi:hypothetical protein
MTADALSAALDDRPFRPARLRLADGSALDVPMLYLSFVNGTALYVARARRSGRDELDPEWVPVGDIVAVERPPRCADAGR